VWKDYATLEHTARAQWQRKKEAVQEELSTN